MRAVVQRVSGASVEVEGGEVSRIEAGLLVYLGVGPEDASADVDETNVQGWCLGPAVWPKS